MKFLVKVVRLALLALTLLVAIPLAYSTARGYTTWWFRSGGYVAVDGIQNGYLHRNSKLSAVIITRTDSNESLSYLVQYSRSKSLMNCGEWHAPRFPIFPIGDVNSPCTFFFNGPDNQASDNAVFTTLSARPGFVEFCTVKGKKVTATW